MLRSTDFGRLLCAALIATLPGTNAFALHGDPHATIRYWDLIVSPITGFDPHETVDDVQGLTDHVGAPTMVTFMENTQGGSCGILYWNPVTNAFKSYAVTGGFDYAGDIRRGPIAGAPQTFGGGDAWSTVNGNADFSPYVNFRGSDDFRRWSTSLFDTTGLRVKSSNGRVYIGDFGGALAELDPATDMLRTWTLGSRPYGLVLDDSFVWITAVAGGGHPDQIVRLNPSTNAVTRWDVPGGGFQAFVSFGAPNSITKDLDGNILFTETDSNEIGRLNPITGLIQEFTKPGIDDPNAIASSGTGASLQAFFTERAGQQISLVTFSGFTPSTSAVVVPTTETIAPSSTAVTPQDFTITPVTATIVPATFDSEGVDPPGIIRFPAPPSTTNPTGMTRVAFPGTVFGSMEGSDHVFEVSSAAITEVCGDNTVNQAPGVEECDGGDDAACPGACVPQGFAGECTCTTCGNDTTEPPVEECDENDDVACPGQCTAPGPPEQCTCQIVGEFCGDNDVNQGPGVEECDGSADSACPGGCFPPGDPDQCTCATCGDDSAEAPVEECDGSDAAACPGQCLPPGDPNQCSCPVVVGEICGDGIVNQGPGVEQCDGSNDSACPGACQPPGSGAECTCANCGDGVHEPPVEECDDGSANSDTTPDACRLNCVLPSCGDGVIDPISSETCDPPAAEICNNMADDDGDNDIDCADADCAFPVGPSCGETCTTVAACKRIARDPAIIRFGRPGEPDYFSIHGRFPIADALEPSTEGFRILVTNADGRVYRASISGRELERRRGGKGRFFFSDRGARRGVPIRDGLYRVGVRVRNFRGTPHLVFRVKAYSDLSAATAATMTTQVVVGNEVASLTADWTQTSRGWRLALSDFR